MNYDTCDGMTYTIKQGDTLYGISRKYDVPLAMILHANPYADVYRLNVGDTICIPVKKKCCKKTCGSGNRSMSEDDDSMNNGMSMENNIAGNLNVSDNTTETRRSTEMSNDMTGTRRSMGMSDSMSETGRNTEMSDGMARSGRNTDMSESMDLPDKVTGTRRDAQSESMTDNNASDDDKWVKYVAQPGDTLFDVFNKSECDLNEFLNKNGLKGIYILPGLVYFVKEK